MPLDKGDRLGPYEIVGVIGKGGMGEVYHAVDTRLNRPVAIKLLRSELADSEARRRFQREAQTASALNHPHIVTVLDVGEIDGREYIVAEFVDGGTLKDWARQETRHWREMIELLTDVADAVATAHDAGILHRDIKPANILLTRSGYAKLADFGLAKLESRLRADSDSTLTLGDLTAPGVTMGTIAYMSPEQASGQAVDARSDIFSFGIVLYELLSGHRPFLGRTDLEVLQKVIHGDAAPLDAAVPADVRAIVAKAMAKDPQERYQSMRDLAMDLRRASTHSRVSARAPRNWRFAWAALVPLGAVVGYVLWPQHSPQQTPPPRAVPFTTLAGIERYPSFSPAGDRIAFSWDGAAQDNSDVYVQQVGSGEPLRLTTDPASDYNPVWSPDGRWIAFLRGASVRTTGIVAGDELRLVPPLGGPERKLAEIHVRQTVSHPAFLTWCPDNTCLVVSDSPGEGRPDALFVVSVETGEKRALTSLDPPAYGDTNPALSPDGRVLVFRRNLAFAAGELYSLSLDAAMVPIGDPRRLTSAELDAGFPVWLPGGKQILFSARSALWRLSIGEDGAAAGDPDQLPFVGEDGLMPAVARGPHDTFRLAYVRRSEDSNVWRIETPSLGTPASGPPVRVISSTRRDHQAHYSPDAAKIAFQSDRSGANEIWIANADGSGTVQLTTMNATVTAHAEWSPEGQRIVFDSNIEGQFELYVMPAAGGRPRRLTNHPASDHFPSFSRDGKWIYFASNRGGTYQVWKMPAEGGEATPFTTQGGWIALESPDGAFVYYTETTGTVPTTLWRLPVAGGKPEKVIDGVIERAFALVPNGMYYVDRVAGEARLEFLDFTRQRSTTIARDLGSVSASLSVSPDGRSVLFTRWDSLVDDLMLVENFR